MKLFNFRNVFTGNSIKKKNEKKEEDIVWNCQYEQWNDVWRSFENFRVACGNSSKNRYINFDSHACFETRFCHTGSTNTRSLWFVDTFDQSQTSIQHSCLCDFMNMKENILFLRNEWTTTGDVDKTDRTDLGKCIHLYDETQGNKETQALSTENCLRQVQKNRQIIIKEAGSKKGGRQEEADVK